MTDTAAAEMSTLLYEASAAADMLHDIVQGSSGKPETWAASIARRLDAHRTGCGWSPHGSGGQTEPGEVEPGERHHVRDTRERQALKWIGTRCEGYTRGRCADNGRTPDAPYTADRLCDGCIAAYGLGLIEIETVVDPPTAVTREMGDHRPGATQGRSPLR